MRTPRPALVVAVVAVAGLALAGAGGGYAAGRATTHAHRIATPAPIPTPSAVAAATDAPGAATTGSPPPEPTAAAITAALAGPLRDPALGGAVLAEVADATTGDVLFARSAAASAAPASTAKLATAAAVLLTHPVTGRITTTVVSGERPGQVVLVGAGDPTLSGVGAGAPTLYADAARLSDLAAQLKSAGVPVSQVVVDDALFSGPAISPAWQPEDVPSDYASAITPILVDGGRATPDATDRSATPDLAAGAALAADLGLPATAVVRGLPAAGAATLAHVDSAPYGELIRQMLVDSDNVLAEVLARQVAVAQARPASFAGAAAAVRAVLLAHGVDIGAGMVDGSGLAGSDRLSPSVLVAVLRMITTTPALQWIVDDLPVAGWDGTLAGRYLAGSGSAPAAGAVRAKTGTLTGVSALAGFVTTASGRLLIVTLIAASVPQGGTDAAENALDLAITSLLPA